MHDRMAQDLRRRVSDSILDQLGVVDDEWFNRLASCRVCEQWHVVSWIGVSSWDRRRHCRVRFQPSEKPLHSATSLQKGRPQVGNMCLKPLTKTFHFLVHTFESSIQSDVGQNCQLLKTFGVVWCRSFRCGLQSSTKPVWRQVVLRSFKTTADAVTYGGLADHHHWCPPRRRVSDSTDQQSFWADT